MSKIAVIYWSGTGNTEAMADLVANAAAAAGASVDKFTPPSSTFPPPATTPALRWAAPPWAPSSWRRASSSQCTRICAAL